MPTFRPNQVVTAAQLNAIVDKIMGTPTSTSSVGSGTASINVEVRDDVLGTFVFTAVAGRRYRAVLAGAKISGTAGTLCEIRLRDGGGSTPTAASTLLAATAAYIPVTGGPGQVTVNVSGTFTPTAGTRTIAAFTNASAGTAATVQVGTRELYVEDVGEA